MDDASVFIASFNTSAVTELCIRSARTLAGYPLKLTVGDAGSTDGSLEMLRGLERRGWLTLETVSDYGHTMWLDKWRAECRSRYAVFVDSDVEFRRAGWLSELVSTAQREGAALVCAEILPEVENVIEPVGGVRMRMPRRPSPWLMLVDIELAREVDASFRWHSEETDRVTEGAVGWDTGSRFLDAIERRGLRAIPMPPSYGRSYRHYGGLSWIPVDAGRRGRQKARDLLTIQRRLARARRREADQRSIGDIGGFGREFGLTAMLGAARLLDRVRKP